MARRIWALLDDATKRGLVWQFLAMIVVTGLELFSIGLVIPLLYALVDPDAIGRIWGGAWMRDTLAGGDSETLVAMFGVVLFIFFAIKTLLVGVCVHWQNHFLLMRQAVFARDLLRQYLGQPYVFHLQRNTAELTRNVTLLSVRVFVRGLMPILQGIMEFLTIVGIGAILLWVDPLASGVMALVLGSSAAIYYLVIRHRLVRWGRHAVAGDTEILQATSQALGSAKLVAIGRNEDFFASAYGRPAQRRARYLALSSTAPYLPRLVIELAAVSGLLLVIAMLTQTRPTDIPAMMTTLAVFGVAALRLMPSLSRLTSVLTTLRENAAAVDVLFEERLSLEPLRHIGDRPKRQSAGAPEIRVEALSFTYPGAAAPALDRVEFVVAKGSIVALIGKSGAGKTTVADVILGLLQPDSGRVLVDGTPIDANLPAWHDRIGYVPQDIFLLDDTLARNIALGEEDASIDRKRLDAAISGAKLDSLVAQLPAGIDSVIGERGKQLSGGQRQRIGIARALYRPIDMLVMDEATSALDVDTEHGIAETIAAFRGSMTVIVIAHRMTTVQHSDRVVFMDGGCIRAVDTFDRLAATDPQFMRLIQLSRISDGESIDRPAETAGP